MAQNAIIIPTNAPLPGIALVNAINNANSSIITLLSGGSAPTAAGLGIGSLAGVLWHNTTAHTISIRDQADTTWILIGTINETTKQFTPANVGGGGGGGGSTGPSIPSGRLSLTSGTTIQTADVVGATSVYYMPYQGNVVPIYSGSVYNTYTFSELTLTLTAGAHLQGKIYDVFVALQGGAVVVGTGPAWTASNSRGTGAGTTQLTRLNGILVNSQVMTLTNGATTYASIAASQCTYVGSIYCTANGQTTMQLNPSSTSGGPAAVMGVYNYYNRVKTTCHASDSTASWLYSTNTWRSANGSNNNRISWLDGRGTAFVEVTYSVTTNGTATAAGALCGIGINSTTSPTGSVGQRYGDYYGSIHAHWVQIPLLGFNYAQALENIITAGINFQGGAGNMKLQIGLEM